MFLPTTHKYCKTSRMKNMEQHQLMRLQMLFWSNQILQKFINNSLTLAQKSG